jgi:hypothetical protein
MPYLQDNLLDEDSTFTFVFILAQPTNPFLREIGRFNLY